jgi:predicted dehydrogenase
MKKKIDVVGVGKFFQTIHLKFVKKYFNIINCYDPRYKLLQLFSKKNKINYSSTNINKLISGVNNVIAFCCSSRGSSYFVLKKIISKYKIIFSEKPLVFNLKDALMLSHLSKKNNTRVKIGFMTRYDRSIIYLKKYLKKKKLLNKIDHAKFELSNNKLYVKKLYYIKTDENNDFSFSKIRYPSWLKKRDQVKYHIFTNRYSHIFNLANFIFQKILPSDLKIIDKYNYHIKSKSNNTEILFKCSNKKSYLIKIFLTLSNGETIECQLKNPTLSYFSFVKIKSYKKNTKIYFKNNLFKSQIKNLTNKKDKSSTNLIDLIRDISLIENIWRTKSQYPLI